MNQETENEKIRNLPKRIGLGIIAFLKAIVFSPINIGRNLFMYFRATLLLLNFVIYHSWKTFWSIKFIPNVISLKILSGAKAFNHRVKGILDVGSKMSLSPSKAMDITMNNLIKKKNRTVITLGGVALGIGAILFLVSLGYGLQNLVIGEVASLIETTQITVTSRNGNINKIDDKVFSKIKNYSEVTDIQPLISVVGKVSYNNSITSLAVYGVSSDYLEKSAIVKISGQYYDSKNLVAGINSINVKGVSDDVSVKENVYSFNIKKSRWVPVYEKSNIKSSLIGYTKESFENMFGKLEEENGNKFINSFYYLWDRVNCSKSDVDCTFGYKVKRDLYGSQILKSGYVNYSDITVDKIIDGNVLGLQDNNSEVLVLGESENLYSILGEEVQAVDDFVQLIDETKPSNTLNVETVTMSSDAIKKGIVNSEFTKLIGLTPESSIGKKIKIIFTIPPELMNKSNVKIESTEVEYEILGVVDTDKSPVIYIPYMDVRSLGIVNNSSLRVTVADKEQVSTIRQRIEGLGFNTNSVLDTVSQVTSLFSSITAVLGIMGFVALAVASLGMFNTFTISLLERTREIGLMKALGMKSNEVKDLFMMESLVMGIGGGILGVILGFTVSLIVNFGVSQYSISQGGGYLTVSSIPSEFTFLILCVSLLVGLVTGLYPAYRSKKISALDALRYE